MENWEYITPGWIWDKYNVMLKVVTIDACFNTTFAVLE